jgi:flagellum-specific ATP synthase
VERSVSRVMINVAAPAHLDAARRLRQLHARYEKARDLIQLGAYNPGHDAELDQAVRLRPAIDAMLQQSMDQRAELDASIAALQRVLGS